MVQDVGMLYSPLVTFCAAWCLWKIASVWCTRRIRYTTCLDVGHQWVLNATFNYISVISWWSILMVGENRSIRRKLLTCRKALTNFITYYYMTSDVESGVQHPLMSHIKASCVSDSSRTSNGRYFPETSWHAMDFTKYT
jgi:hypothetical protein